MEFSTFKEWDNIKPNTYQGFSVVIHPEKVRSMLVNFQDAFIFVISPET